MFALIGLAFNLALVWFAVTEADLEENMDNGKGRMGAVLAPHGPPPPLAGLERTWRALVLVIVVVAFIVATTAGLAYGVGYDVGVRHGIEACQ